MNPKQQIYWHTTTVMPGEENTITPLPEKVDVAVIGGGYTGLSAARTLAKRGVKVVVLEAETIGWGASSRNGGMVLTGLKIAMQTATKRYGRERAKQLFQCSLDSIDTVEQIVKEENEPSKLFERGKAFHAIGDLTRAEQYYAAAMQSAAVFFGEGPSRLRSSSNWRNSCGVMRTFCFSANPVIA